MSNFGTNFKKCFAPVTGLFCSSSFTNSHFRFLITVLASALYVLPVHFDTGKHVFPSKTATHYEHLCGIKIPISFTLHISLSQDRHLIYYPLCHLLHGTPDTSAASYRTIKYLKNLTLQSRESYRTRLEYRTIEPHYTQTDNLVYA